MPITNSLEKIRLRMEYKYQKDFAEFLELGQSNYSLIANNKKQVSLEEALRIAKKLSMPVEQIFELID